MTERGPHHDMTNWTEPTTGLCPECLRDVPATIAVDDGRIWMTQTCPRHGESKALLASDAGEYLRLRQYVPERLGGGCCGEGTVCETGPPTCVLLLEITQACNLRCPTCYADAHGHDFMDAAEARRRLDAFFRTQSRLDVLMLSGGEPTIHPRLDEMLALALEYPINRVLVNTNGVRLTQSPKLVETLAKHGDRVELYLSYGSFRPAVHERLYGKDLTVVKRRAVEVADEAGLFVTLVPTVEGGVNDDEIGDLYRYARSARNVNGITFQPVMDNGRYEHDYDPAARLTLTGVLAAIEAQTSGELRSSDFVGLPCSHPDCCALTYGLRDAGRTGFTPITRHLEVTRYLDLFSDRISFTGLVEGALKRVWSDVASLRAGRTLRDLATLYRAAGLGDLLPLRGDRKALGERVFRVVVKPFMDASTYDHARVGQCCTKIVDESGAAVSFCEYNVFRRGRVARPGATPLKVLA